MLPFGEGKIMFKSLVWGAALAMAVWLAAPAAAQTWTKSGDRLNLDLARISVPISPGVTSYYETREFSHKGTGLDTAAEFQSSDEAVFATVYAYLPTLADPGLTAFTTDMAITINYGGPVQRGPEEIRAAAGHPAAALETRYENYRGTLASRAAFLRVDRWLIKVRVSGPESRRAEVDATMAAILDGMRVSRDAKVAPVHPIVAEPCALPSGGDAKLLPDDSAATLEDSLTAVIDPTEALPARKNAPGIPPRLGSRWCRATIEAGSARVPILVALDAAQRKSGESKSVLLILYSDGGAALEILRSRRGYLLLHHKIAEATILGTFDGLPSESQIRALLAGTGGDALRIRARIELRPSGDTTMLVPPIETPKRQAPRTISSSR
jgi:hypothetical protein